MPNSGSAPADVNDSVAAIYVGDWGGTSAEGASVERRRREDRGAEGVG